MSKRIIKETLTNGKEKYRIQNNSHTWPLWVDETIILWRDGIEVCTEAVFDTYKEAMDYINPPTKVVSKEVVYKN